MNEDNTFLARIAVRNERLLEFSRSLVQECESETDCMQGWRDFVDMVNSDMANYAKLRHNKETTE